MWMTELPHTAFACTVLLHLLLSLELVEIYPIDVGIIWTEEETEVKGGEIGINSAPTSLLGSPLWTFNRCPANCEWVYTFFRGSPILWIASLVFLYCFDTAIYLLFDFRMLELAYSPSNWISFV